MKPPDDVYLLISTGSGKKLDEELSQPFLEELNAQLTTHRPGQLAFHRLDRIFEPTSSWPPRCTCASSRTSP
jgi:hypothetical protein